MAFLLLPHAFHHKFMSKKLMIMYQTSCVGREIKLDCQTDTSLPPDQSHLSHPPYSHTQQGHHQSLTVSGSSNPSGTTFVLSSSPSQRSQDPPRSRAGPPEPLGALPPFVGTPRSESGRRLTMIRSVWIVKKGVKCIPTRRAHARCRLVGCTRPRGRP